MTVKLVAIAILLSASVSAHRLDEYLQATLVSLENDHVGISIRLVPGVAVSTAVLATIDSNHDGVISAEERRAYTQQVLRDLSINLDGRAVAPRLLSTSFPSIQDMKEGIGEIQIDIGADLWRRSGNRRLVIDNHHQTRFGVYLVNCLVPRDPEIHVIAQHRNETQSFYQLDFEQGVGSQESGTSSDSGGIAPLFRLGMRHIAEGTDHLLFLLVLLLPAPLVVVHHRWSAIAPARASVLRIAKVVTAFTIGHSTTLALAAFGVISLPSRPIEVLIAVSIFISAVHAIRPLFPGREAAIAAFFGLIHGLAFASTLGQLGLGRWQRVTGILGFNLGIETMQIVVVAATMPSLLLLSRTRGYSLVRIGGALFAGAASLGWIAERALGAHLSVDAVVNQIAGHA